MSECDHNCSTCSANCDQKSMVEKTHELSFVKKVVAVVSGKGGVGKSLVTGLLASLSQKSGFKTAVLDADITGPSIPRMFGIRGGIEGDDVGIYPRRTKSGIKVISANLLLEQETDPVLWRGPIIAGMVKQFWTDVIWDEVDFMFVDMPPGTGDVPLTVFQSLKIDGIIVVTSPQELVTMIVEKAVKMANMMKIPILGVVENMSYVKCPECGGKIDLYGSSKIDQVATDFHLKVLGRLPIDPAIAKACDEGRVEEVVTSDLDAAMVAIKSL